MTVAARLLEVLYGLRAVSPRALSHANEDADDAEVHDEQRRRAVAFRLALVGTDKAESIGRCAYGS